ncbi:hypothetical protein MPSEU_000510200 [Mayamaea pseudoterrestris]|nr:hypothetical protein MPSEU_000510200 [Mayamaea pseudoterrestris]
MPSARRRLRLRSYNRPASGVNAYLSSSMTFQTKAKRTKKKVKHEPPTVSAATGQIKRGRGRPRKITTTQVKTNEPKPIAKFEIEVDESSSDDDDDSENSSQSSDRSNNTSRSGSSSDSEARILQPNSNWDASFARLLAWKRKHGDVSVPQRLTNTKEKKLSNWVMRQRKLYRKFQLRPDHFERLERVGFCFRLDSSRNPIQSRGGVHPKYKDCKYEIPKLEDEIVAESDDEDDESEGDGDDENEDADGEEVSYGSESNDEEGNLSKAEDSDQDWISMYDCLRSDKHDGGALVPGGYVRNTKLAAWTAKQRKLYKQGQLSEDRIIQLESIGFVWVVHGVEEDTDEMTARPIRKAKETATRRIRADSESMDVLDDDDKVEASEAAAKGAAAMTSNPSQVREYRDMVAKVKARLPPPRDPASMTPSQLEDYIQFYDTMLPRLKAYVQEYGDALVPQHFARDIDLGAWVSSQRHKLLAQTLDQDRFQHLCDSHFVWKSSRTRQPLEISLSYVKGALPPPPQFTRQRAASFERPLTTTVSKIATQPVGEYNNPSAKQPIISVNSRETLDAIKACLPLLTQRKLDSNRLQLLRAYVQKHGHARVPRSYAQDGLGEWVNSVRRRLRVKALSQEQFELLNGLGFSWSFDTKHREQPLRLEDFLSDALEESSEEVSAEEGRGEEEDDNDDDVVSVSLKRSTEDTNDLQEFYTRVKKYLPPPPDPKSMTPAQKALEAHFQRNLKMLKKFIKKYGHARVPQKAREHIELGQWVNVLRKKLKSQSLQQHHFEKLNEYGFAWQVNPMKIEVPVVLSFLPKSESVQAGSRNVKKMRLSDEPNAPSTSSDGSGAGAQYSRGLVTAPAKTKTQLLYPRKQVSTADYRNVEALLAQLFLNPLIKEYACKPFESRHPELAYHYNRVDTDDSIDLDIVASRIKARCYETSRDILDELCRVFDQSIEVFSLPQVIDASLSVSIVSHLKDYVIMLWQEYMLPSEPPSSKSDVAYPLYEERETSRTKRMQNSGHVPFTARILNHLRFKLDLYVASSGGVDDNDNEDLWALAGGTNLDTELKGLVAKMSSLSKDSSPNYNMHRLHNDLLSCVPKSLSQFYRITQRLERFFWKLTTPVHEANTRGVDSSSMWGDVVTTIYARDKSSKPYWPSLCLGVIAPVENREDWHATITERNERRLPKAISDSLVRARETAERSVQKSSNSYFLVEFLGSHEYDWVRSSNVLEYDADEDPNINLPQKAFGKHDKQTMSDALTEVATVTEQYAAILDSVFDWEESLGRQPVTKASNHAATSRIPALDRGHMRCIIRTMDPSSSNNESTMTGAVSVSHDSTFADLRLAMESSSSMELALALPHDYCFFDPRLGNISTKLESQHKVAELGVRDDAGAVKVFVVDCFGLN